MSIQLSPASFLQVLSRSQLLTDEQLRDVRESVSRNSELQTAAAISNWLIERELITPWQAEKLCQARHRGFFLGPYKLLDRVARGGMSTIYAAIHRETGDVRALKVLPLKQVSAASYLPRFQREASVTMRLRHPNIIRVYEVLSESDGRHDIHFMTMDLLTGRDLFDLVSTDGPLPCRRAAEYIRQAAEGLQHAHDAGLVHRDVKPGNLFLEAGSETIRVLDLGLAQEFDSEENLTQEFNERVLGTADYLSPEQAADSHLCDHRADLYSLGCTFYFLLTGQPPFTDGTLVQRIVAHQTRSPVSVTEYRNDVPDELVKILQKMMVRDRELRLQTARDAADQLKAWLVSAENEPQFDICPPNLKAAPVRTVRRSESPLEEFPRDASSAGLSRDSPVQSAALTSKAELPEVEI
ncbi:MAG: serine/threonine protein kinase, partial [Planctomycetaceae bacterium]|nr:serine/threonine protein kinase [Planctomycetaceae bacterium]